MLAVPYSMHLLESLLDSGDGEKMVKGVVKPLDRRPARTRWMRAGVRCVTAVGVVSQTAVGVGNCRNGECVGSGRLW